MGRKPIPINLKATSPEDETYTFTSIPESASGLGFSEQAVEKAYRKDRTRIGEYQLGWLEPEIETEEDPKIVERIERTKTAFDTPNCSYCGKPLTRKDRVEDGFRIMRMGKDGYPVEEYNVKSLYEAHKLTGLSLPSLINAAEKGSVSITRKKIKKSSL